MVKITSAEAISFATEHFPKGPEKLAQFLGIDLRYSHLSCDGWCIQGGPCKIIRINNSVVESRRRFTLAHELSHVVLGIPSLVGESALEVRKSLNENERQVNELAAEILLPITVAKDLVKNIPITAKNIKTFAKKANTSEVFIARRLASLATDIQLQAGTVLFYNKSVYAWQWPDHQSVKVNSNIANQILTECLNKDPSPARIQLKSKNVVVASLLENPFLDVKTIFVQVVEEQHGIKKLDEELARDLLSVIFADDETFKNSLQGCFGSIKPKIMDMPLEKAVTLFNKLYTYNEEYWNEYFRAQMATDTGQQYIRLRLKMFQQS